MFDEIEQSPSSMECLEIAWSKLQIIILHEYNHFRATFDSNKYTHTQHRTTSWMCNCYGFYYHPKHFSSVGKDREKGKIYTLSFEFDSTNEYTGGIGVYLQQKMCQRNEPLVAFICWTLQNLWPTMYCTATMVVLYTLPSFVEMGF